MYDTEVKRYLDCLVAYSAVNQGHCLPAILNAMNRSQSPSKRYCGPASGYKHTRALPARWSAAPLSSALLRWLQRFGDGIFSLCTNRALDIVPMLPDWIVAQRDTNLGHGILSLSEIIQIAILVDK